MTQALKGYLDKDGKFSKLPGKRQKRKLDAMIAALAIKFRQEGIYSEQEINTILNRHHSFNDPATLRRLLIGSGYMDRSIDGRQYWLIKSPQKNHSSVTTTL